TPSNLPAIVASVGDLEFGDVDDDGDLDVILADWGADTPVDDMNNSSGGVTQLWLQDEKPGFFGEGSAVFVDATLSQMPNVGIRWSWDLEFVDLDNDYDLDAVVSCFACTKASLFLFANDGKGTFTQVPMTNAPQGAGALSVEAINLDGDAFLDLVTTHDATGGRNRVLLADGQGAFADWSGQLWPMLENPSSFDTMAAFLDFNSDARPDIVLGALQAGLNKYPDRLLENQNGKFKANTFAFAETKASSGTYAIVLADFNLDRRLDVAMSQNENAFEKKVFLGSEVELQPDTEAPQFVNYQKLPADIEFGQDYMLRLRCHDNKSPLMLHDFQRAADGNQDGRPYVESWNSTPADPNTTPPDNISAPGQWYGEYLWRVGFSVPLEADPFVYRICAIDAAGNKRCTEPESVDNPAQETGTETESTTTTGDAATLPDTITDPTTETTQGTVGEAESLTGEANTDPNVPTTGAGPLTDTVASASESENESIETLDADELDDDGCGCDTTQSPTRGVLSSLALLGLLGLRRRRARA
ncbi:MAG TPA: VCBS repeat-containing protein, partial [Nannocystis sp.]